MKRVYKSFDYLLFSLVIIVAIFGIIVIGSATHINIDGSSQEYKSQLIWFISGIVFLLLAAFIDYHFICKFYIAIYIVNIILLITVLILNHGEEVARWIYLGRASIQPSEFAKVFMIIFLSTYLSKKYTYINKFHQLALFLLLSFIPVVLIIIQPSLSASLVFFAITFSLLYLAGINYKYIYITILILIPIIVFIYIDMAREEPYLVSYKIIQSYQADRIKGLLYPDSLDRDSIVQSSYSVYAIAIGELSGHGLYKGPLSQLNFILESHNDFIFAVIGEEFGFIGSFAIIFILLVVILKCMYISYKAVDLLGKFIAASVGSMFAFQVFINIGVATGILPNTGISLPFVSYGGSAMWINMIAVGLVINVAMTKRKSIFER